MTAVSDLKKLAFMLVVMLSASGCVNTPVNPPDAKIIVGYRWKDVPWSGGIYLSGYPFNAATGAAGRMYVPSGQAHFQTEVLKPESNDVAYESISVVSGDYVIGHTHVIRGDNTFKWICPAYAFSVAPGSTTYIGDLNFDGFEFTGLTFDIDALSRFGLPDASGAVQAIRVSAPVNYKTYTNPGLSFGVPESPCAAEG